MDLEGFKQLARNAYRKEYVAKTPVSFREKAFLYPAATMLKGGAWIAAAALTAMIFGVTAAAPVLAVSLLSVAAALPLMHFGSTLHDRRAEAALERDINNGTLIAHFQKQMLPQPRQETATFGPQPVPESSVSEAGLSKLIVLSAKDSFNQPEAAKAPAYVPVPAPAQVLRPAAA